MSPFSAHPVLACIAVTITAINLWEISKALFARTAFFREAREVWAIYQIRKQGREHVKRASKIKGRIVEIGELTVGPDGRPILGEGWSFDITNGALHQYADENGVIYFCGYSGNELIEIYKRRDEYVDRPLE